MSFSLRATNIVGKEQTFLVTSCRNSEFVAFVLDSSGADKIPVALSCGNGTNLSVIEKTGKFFNSWYS
jgi:hypothetical protein